MSSELVAVIVGGAIGIVGGLVATVVLKVLDSVRHTRSIRAVTAAEVTAIMEKAQRFLEGKSTAKELRASTPMLVSIASELGYLSPRQVIAVRRAITLDMEMRAEGDKDKAKTCISSCKEALRFLSV